MIFNLKKLFSQYVLIIQRMLDSFENAMIKPKN